MSNRRTIAAAALVGLLLGVTACSGGSGDSGDGSLPQGGQATPAATGAAGSDRPRSAGSSGAGSPSASPRKHYPSGPPLQVQSIAPLSGATVGVAMPISIVFTNPVASSARKGIEKHLKVTTSTPVTGAWHWFSERRVDFRPTTYWTPGTTVSLDAALAHVGDGNGRYGTHSYTRRFTIGDDVRTHVFVKAHKTVVKKNGTVLRTMPSDAGSPDWPSWDGTMAVVNKSRTVRMTSCSVGISCDKNSKDFYDLTLPWDVRITWSGTFLHYSTGDPHPGHSYGSHGCVHLSYADAQWYYNLVKQGDPVTVTGSPRGKADGDNGYADYNLSWDQWLAGSATGAMTTSPA